MEQRYKGIGVENIEKQKQRLIFVVSGPPNKSLKPNAYRRD